MKTFKIIIGFLLIYAAASEYISASRQLGSLFSPGVLMGVLIILIFSAWLIGTAFTGKKLSLKSFDYLKVFIVSIVVFVVVAIFSLSAKIVPRDFAEINGLKVPLGKCIAGTSKIIPDKKERIEACKCFVEKVTSDPELKIKYQKKLENNQLDLVLKQVQLGTNFQELGIQNCFAATSAIWSERIAKTMKQNFLQELSGTEFEETNDIEKYSECVIEAYKKFPLKKILEEDFADSYEAIEINHNCTAISLK